MLSHVGELAALITAFCWTVTALSFEAAGRRIGSLAVNLLRLLLAFVWLTLYNAIARDLPLPTDASGHAWLWLAASGVVGFLIGDLALFRAFVLIGSRLSMLLMALVPPMTALIGWFFLGEGLGAFDLLGMTLTLAGVCWVVAERAPNGANGPTRRPWGGIALGFVGALGQAVGLVFSKVGMGSYSPFAATQIRVLTGVVGFSLLFAFIGWWPKVIAGLKEARAMRLVTLGSIFGPFLGVSFSLLAVQRTQAGVAATIMSIVPVLIIPPSVWIFKERVSPRAAFGAAVAVAGVALLFWPK
ncbi:MAG: DMT family transporter [Myxococcales bacterium]|nr:MAG: DMT family transporter [Myxococcales bacterium]